MYESPFSVSLVRYTVFLFFAKEWTNMSTKSNRSPEERLEDLGNGILPPKLAIDNMSQATLRELKKAQRLEIEYHGSGIENRRQLGEIIARVEANRNGQYGSTGASELFYALGISAYEWNSARDLAKNYSAYEVQKLTEHQSETGRAIITWCHLRALLPIRDKKQRDQLLHETIQEQWTAEELADYVCDLIKFKEGPSLAPASGDTKRGRPLAAPKNFNQCLNQQINALDNILLREAKVWSLEKYSLQGMARLVSNVTLEHKEQLLKLRDDYLRMLDKVPQLLNEVDEALAYIEKELNRASRNSVSKETPINETGEEAGDTGAKDEQEDHREAEDACPIMDADDECEEVDSSADDVQGTDADADEQEADKEAADKQTLSKDTKRAKLRSNHKEKHSSPAGKRKRAAKTAVATA
jgi:hypothetical protein